MKLLYLIFVPLAVNLYVFFRLRKTLAAQDHFLKTLYDHHYALWVRLDRPTGWCWKPTPKDSGFDLNGHLPFNRPPNDRPDWLTEAPELIDKYDAVAAGNRYWNRIGFPIFVVSSAVAVLLLWLHDQR